MREVSSAAVTPSEVLPKFDYRSLQPSVAKFLAGQAIRIQGYSGKAIIQIGKDLIGAKHYLSHGQFLRWVEDEVGLPARTAQAYMRVANWVSSKSATVAHLPPTALYALSSPGLPAEFVEGVVTRVERGERIQLPALRAQIKALRHSSECQDQHASGEGLDDQQDDAESTVTTAMISHAVSILARALTVSDFAKVRHIITSKPVLNDPNLPNILARAFQSCESAPSPGAELSSGHQTSHLKSVGN